MSKDLIEELSDGQMSDMFTKIGRAKEDTAKNIIKKQEEANETKRRQSGAFFGNSTGNTFGEDVDLDEMERRINAELEIARRGTTLDKSQVNASKKTLKDGPRKDVFDIDALLSSIETSANQSPPAKEPISEPDIEINFEIEDNEMKIEIPEDVLTEAFEEVIEEDDEPLDENPVNTSTEDAVKKFMGIIKEIPDDHNSIPEAKYELAPAEEIPSPSVEGKSPELLEILDILAPEKDKGMDTGYFSLTKDIPSGKVGYAFVIALQDGRRIIRGNSRAGQNAVTATFDGVVELFDVIEQEGLTSFILCTDSDTCKLLKRNATYGIVDGYSESCVNYIAQTKKISEKCYLRIADNELDQASQYMALAATTANALACGINK